MDARADAARAYFALMGNDERSTPGPMVLLVDDDSDLVQLVEHVLEQRGIRFVTAENGQRALSLLETVGAPDVIVTDMMMPKLDGLGLMKALAERPEPHPPVIAVSGFLPYLEEARELGAVATMAKPYNPRALASLIYDVADGDTPPHRPPPRGRLEDERARLRAVFDLRLNEPSVDPAIQRFLDETAAIFRVPIAGISAVTEDRQRFVATCRSAPEDLGTPRANAFCTHAIAARAALVIQNASENPFFSDNPDVIERGFQFYAGVPLISAQGYAVGTLCLVDFEPRAFTYLELELLGLLARRVLAALEWRKKRQQPDVPDAAYRHLQCLDEQLGIYGKALFADLVVLEASRGVQCDEPRALVAVAVSPRQLEATVAALREIDDHGLIGRLGLARLGAVLPDMSAAEARELVSKRMNGNAIVAATDLTQYQGATDMALLHVEQALGDAGLS